MNDTHTIPAKGAGRASSATATITLEIGEKRGTIRVSRRVAEMLLDSIKADGRTLKDFLLEDLSAALYGSTTDALRRGDRYSNEEIDTAAQHLLELTTPYRQDFKIGRKAAALERAGV